MKLGRWNVGTLASIIGIALVIASCAPHVGVRAWEQMSPHEKLIYVRSMIGHERVKARKGGNQLHWNLPPEEYVRRIDAAVRSGDQRPPVAIFEGMGTR